MVFGNGVKNIQAAAFNGARTVCLIKIFIFCAKGFKFWSNVSKYRLKNPKCGKVKPGSDIPQPFLIKYQKF